MLLSFGCVGQNGDSLQYSKFGPSEILSYTISDGGSDGLLEIKYQTLKAHTYLGYIEFFTERTPVVIIDTLTKAIVSRIPSPRPEMQVYGFLIWGEDSVIIQYNPSDDPGQVHDSTLLLCNFSGKVLSAVDLNKIPVITRSQLKEKQAGELAYLNILSRTSLKRWRNYLILDVLPFTAECIGNPEYNKEGLNCAYGVNITHPDAPALNIPVQIPSTPGAYFAVATSPFYSVVTDSEYVVTWAHKQSFSAVNLATGSVRTRDYSLPFSKEAVPTVWANDDNCQTIKHDNPLSIALKDIFYDVVSHKFVLKVVPPAANSGTLDLNHKVSTMLVEFDSDFSPFSVKVFPLGFNFIIGCVNDRIVMYDLEKNASSSADSLYMAVFSGNLTRNITSQEALLQTTPTYLETRGMESLLRDHYPDMLDQNGVVAYFPVIKTCSPCLQAFLNKYSISRKKYSKAGVKCIVSHREGDMWGLEFSEEDLEKMGIVYDSEALYRTYLGVEFATSVLLLIENGAIVKQIPLDDASKLGYLDEMIDIYIKDKDLKVFDHLDY